MLLGARFEPKITTLKHLCTFLIKINFNKDVERKHVANNVDWVKFKGLMTYVHVQ